MGLLEQLQDKGWHLLPAGLERLQEGATGTNIDANQVIKLALDIDLREIGGGALSSISTRGNKADSIDGNVVVQILKIRNISAPKSNEQSKVAPRLLKLTITDGQIQYSALEAEHISAISLDTPPGTKIYLKNGPIKISQGLLLLSVGNVSVLGGKVASLAEKWELGRAMAKYAKGGRIQLSAFGPPPWIPFGQKIQPSISSDKNFKSLQTKEKDDTKENAEFTALRNDAIAEATKLGTKKIFGGGAKQLVDANVQKIIDKGFTEDQANHALKLTRNNVHRALSNLQRIEDRKQVQSDIRSGKIEPPQKLGKRGLNGKRDLESDTGSKPSAKVSLFDFLEDILPENDAANKKSSSKETTPVNGKETKQITDVNPSKTTPNSAYNNVSTNIRSSSSLPSGNTPNQQTNSNSFSQYNSVGKSYNQQRFENNISSSFANRNSHGSSTSRNYNQHDHNTSHSTGPRQFPEYNNNRYRGSANAASANNESRSRQDSKYNQSQSGYNSYQQHSNYKNDNTNANPGPQRGKFNSNVNNNGKSQQSNSSNNFANEAESKTGQNNNNPGDLKRSRAPLNPYQQQQSHQTVQGYHSGNKQVQGYNPSTNSSDLGSHYGNTNNHHLAQQKPNNYNNNSFDNGSNVINTKPQKGSRYGRHESQNYAGPLSNGGPKHGKQPNPKAQNLPQPQDTGASQTEEHQIVGGNKHNNTSHDNTTNKMVQLTQATANMQITNNHMSNNSLMIPTSKVPLGHTNRPVGPTTPPSAPPIAPVIQKNFIQLPNGFNYNPYQIMGFQNKQTNEFALNVLKSQQFDALQTAHLATPPGAPNVQTPMPGVTIPSPTSVVPAVLASGPPAATIHPAIPSTTAATLPVWKVGDRCLAKYWEDGGFYNAEITGISKNTFVVCFLEYGNFEEVLKTDCIPLTQSAVPPSHGPSTPSTMGFHPATSAHLPPGAPIMPQTALPTAAYIAHETDNLSGQYFNQSYKTPTSQYSHHPAMHNQSHQQQRPAKFREQRPMYVPPAQRK